MNQIIKTKIDGVPVEIEITKMGPATAPEVNKLENNIAKEDKNYIVTAPQEIKLIRIGEDGKANTEDVAKVKAALENSGKTPTALVEDLVNSIEAVPAGKDWWASKVVWVNVISILSAIAAHFGFTSFQIDPQLFDTIFPIIIAVINVYLRKGTNVPLSNKVIPRIADKK